MSSNMFSRLFGAKSREETNSSNTLATLDKLHEVGLLYGCNRCSICCLL